MWDDVIIGDGEKRSSAALVPGIEGNHRISENDLSYWIVEPFLGIGMTVYKNTYEGQTITEYIIGKRSIEEINYYLLEIAMDHLPLTTLVKFIEKSNEKHFDLGKKAKALEIRKVIGS